MLSAWPTDMLQFYPHARPFVLVAREYPTSHISQTLQVYQMCQQCTGCIKCVKDVVGGCISKWHYKNVQGVSNVSRMWLVAALVSGTIRATMCLRHLWTKTVPSTNTNKPLARKLASLSERAC